MKFNYTVKLCPTRCSCVTTIRTVAQKSKIAKKAQWYDFHKTPDNGYAFVESC